MEIYEIYNYKDLSSIFKTLQKKWFFSSICFDLFNEFLNLYFFSLSLIRFIFLLLLLWE